MGKQTHGLSGTSEYRAWNNMLQRCTNPKSPNYQYYGGRGISVDPRWLSFEVFLADMGPKPSPEHSIERRNVHGNYEPGNCYWATLDEQMNNRQDNVRHHYRGREYTSAQLSREFGISQGVFASRFATTNGDLEAIGDPSRWPKQLYTHEGTTATLREWSRISGISYHTLYNRITVRKMTIGEALNPK